MPLRPPHTVRALTASAVLFVVLGVSGCAASDPSTASENDAGPVDGSAYPLTVDNCGTEVTFEEAPERVLAIKSTSIEMMLALGLEDRLIGTAFSDGPLAEGWAAAADGIPVVSEKVPGQEATLALEPDLVYAGWESNVTADGAGDREILATLGVNTYVSPSACQAPDYQPNSLGFDDVFADVEEMGNIFDVPEQAAALVHDMQDRLDAVTPDDRGLSALWFSSGSDTRSSAPGSVPRR